MQIEELDAEIKHAFNDLQHNDEIRRELSSRTEMLGTELQGTRKELELAAEEIERKSKESQAAISAHHQRMVCCLRILCFFKGWWTQLQAALLVHAAHVGCICTG